MATQQIEITPDMQMGDIINVYPSAKRALFQKYHIGGCQSCGYSLDETLEQVFINHNRPTMVNEAIEQIYESARVDEEMQMSPQELKKAVDSGEDWKIIDVRDPYEVEVAPFPGAEVLTREMAGEMLHSWPKDTKIVFFCHVGIRSLEAASYFKGHNMPNVKSLKGGIDRWAVEIDNSIPRY